MGQAEVAVNWCPALGTVLSNEEVIDGLSERGSHPVIRKVLLKYDLFLLSDFTLIAYLIHPLVEVHCSSFFILRPYSMKVIKH